MTANETLLSMPIVDAKEVLPVNIALWPSSLEGKIKKQFLVVHKDPLFTNDEDD